MQCGAARELCLIPHVTKGECVLMPVCMCMHVYERRNAYMQVHVSFIAGVCLYEAVSLTEDWEQVVFDMLVLHMT